MSRAKRYTLGDYEFHQQQFLVTFIKEMIKAVPDKQMLPVRAYGFLMDLLAMHPRSVEKMGCGVLYFFVDRMAESGKIPSRCFHLMRTDGSSTDFSYHECLKVSHAWHDVQACCRYLVAQQIFDFRASEFRRSATHTCPLTQLPVTLENCHVDHEKPQFVALVRNWLASVGLTAEQIQVVHSGDNCSDTRFADTALANAWAVYHLTNAKLRLTTKQGNSTRKRKEVLV